MALDFPTSPTVGQQYGGYSYDGTKWKVTTTSTAPASIGPTPPASATNGDMWWNSTDGTQFMYYNDGSSAQWVESRSAIASAGYYSPNYIINGGFDIWQRGTSFSYSSPTIIYTADRWSITNAGGSGTPAFTVSRQTGVPSVTQYAFRFQRNSGSTATTYGYFAYSMESVDSIPLASKQVTLSFYARAGANYSPTSSLITTRIATGTGTDQSINSTGLTGQVNNDFSTTLTSSWQRFSYSITVPSNATQVALQWFAQFTGTAGTNDYFEISGVQLEQGSTATTFRRNANSLQGELAACQRYYYKWQGLVPGDSLANANFWMTNRAWGAMNLPVTMRAAPTVSQGGAGWHILASNANLAITVFGFGGSTQNTLALDIQVASGGTQNISGTIRVNVNSGTSYVEASAELQK